MPTTTERSLGEGFDTMMIRVQELATELGMAPGPGARPS